jgi:hypothetical protein
MRLKHIIIFIIGLFVSCNSNLTEYGNAELSKEYKSVNISNLMENPADFNNDTLKIEGELHLDLENRGVFLKSNKIWINTFKPATDFDSVWNNMNGEYVEIIGLYQSEETGHLGIYNGQFKEVYYIKTD